MQIERIETDVLIVGGGIAGLMSAIRARELGADVIVAEKANTLRSGDGGMGNDHFVCYIPEVHGPDIEPFVKKHSNNPRFRGMMMPEKFWRTRLEKSFEMLKLWDSWGIPMKYKGRYEFSGHILPGQESTSMALRYSGRNQKPVLTKQALKRGVKIVNRIMVIDLLVDDTIIGAIGLHARENKIIEFRAKSVVLGTGECHMLYPGPTPGWLFNRRAMPALTGDGRAMAYRAGAELFNMEVVGKGAAGPKYFARSGKGTWVGVVRDPEGKPIGPFVTKPHRIYGDPILDQYPALFEEYEKSAKGPVYIDCSGISDEDLEYQTHWLGNEGNLALLNHLKEEKIDLRKNAIEFMRCGLSHGGGILYNEKSETSVNGLYAAGGEYIPQISTAAAFGWIAGENAAIYAQEKASKNDFTKAKGKIEEKSNLLDRVLGRETGATWQEAIIGLQQVMQDYAGTLRSEHLLTAGLRHLRKLREKAYETMAAKNQHELMHCMEVLNLFDIGELVFVAAMERKESRGGHVRADYPFTNPLLDKMLVCRNVDSNITTEWKERIN